MLSGVRTSVAREPRRPFAKTSFDPLPALRRGVSWAALALVGLMTASSLGAEEPVEALGPAVQAAGVGGFHEAVLAGVDVDCATPAEHDARVFAHVRDLFPGDREEIEAAQTVRWSESYAQGAYAHFAPGQLRAFAGALGQPVGRMHFAGEHTELEAPGMEGALRSGRRAAVEVIRALG